MAKEKLTASRKIFRRGETKLVEERDILRRYRYRTPALTGPWRESPEDAVGDAVRAKQAQPDRDQPSGVKWIVPGEIEVRSKGEAVAGTRR